MKTLKVIKIIFASLFAVLAFFKVAQEDKLKTEVALSFELQDSIQFKMLVDPLLTDISPDANHVMFFHGASGDCLIFDKTDF